MGYQLKNKLSLSIYVEHNQQLVEIPLTGQTTLTQMYLVESTRQAVPTLYLELQDGDKFFSAYPILDGQRIVVVVQPYESVTRQYVFRVFSFSSNFTGITTQYKIDAYADHVNYWFGTSCEGYNGSTSSVIQTIASKCGLTSEVDATHDSQLWMQSNRTYNDFVSYLSSNGYVNDESYMVRCLRLDSTLVYKNVNQIKQPLCEVVVYTEKQGAVLATDANVKSNSGLNNMQNYSAVMQGPDAYTNLSFTPTENNLSINTQINSQVKRGKISYQYVGFNTYTDYWKARYQNNRFAKLYNVDCSFITPSVTDLSPLNAFQLSIPDSEGQLDVSDSGLYIVDTRTICVAGVSYAERINATRKGIN